eukprot:m.241935 g.241935  ORF g.241935 m.241935 type:complete len:191 (+) comp19431_c0_seq1:276-848(+)
MSGKSDPNRRAENLGEIQSDGAELTEQSRTAISSQTSFDRHEHKAGKPAQLQDTESTKDDGTHAGSDKDIENKPNLSVKQKLKRFYYEYKEKLKDLPLRWKLVWVFGIVIWAPLAYTVLLIIPGSMVMFVVFWTAFVLKYGTKQEPGQLYENDDSGSDIDGDVSMPLLKPDIPLIPVVSTYEDDVVEFVV